MLPHTAERDALMAIRKVCGQLDRAMTAHDWPMTFSVGVGVFPQVPGSVDIVVAFCDRLMQRVKALGKNKVMHRIYDPDEVESPLPGRVHAIR